MPLKNNSFIKSIIYFTLSYLTYLFSIMFLLKVNLFWIFSNFFDISEVAKWFPIHFKVAYFLFKAIPLLGVFLVLLSNLYLIFKLKNKFLEAYNDHLFKKITNHRSLTISLIFLLNALLLIINKSSFNETHINAMLVFTFIYYLFSISKLIKFKTIQIFYLIFLGLTLRLIYYSLTSAYDLQGDSLARVAQVYDWETYGGLPGGLSWLPMYHVFVYYLGKLLNVPFEVSGRFFSLISSILLIPVLYNFNEKTFNKNTAFVSVLFYVLNPFFIRYSTVQLTTIPFVLFIIFGIYLAYLYFKNEKTIPFIFSIISLNIACLLRFEAWIIIPLFSIVFFFKYYKFKKIFSWSVLSLLAAMIIATITYQATGDFLWGVSDSDIQVRQDLAGLTAIDSIKTLISWPWIPLYFIPLIVLALLDSVKSNKNRFFALSLIILSSYYLFKTLDQTLMPFWRYYGFLIITIVPFMFYWLQKKINFNYLIIFFFFFYTIKSSRDINAVYAISDPLPNGFFESAIYFKTHHLNDPSAKIIFSKKQLHPHDFWRIYSNLENDIYLKKYKRTFSNYTLLKENKDFTTKNISKKIIEENYNFILTQKGYEIDSVFVRVDVQNYLSTKKVDTLKFNDFTLLKID